MKISDSNKRIRELLTKNGMTQTEFCQKTGITKSALSNYLNGDRQPRQDQIMRIADAFEVSPSWLLGYDVPMQSFMGELVDSMKYMPDLFIEPEYQSDESTILRRRLYIELLSAARHCTADQIKLAVNFLSEFSKQNQKED